MGTKECGHECAMSSPSIGEAGRTGDWRSKRPVIEPAKCLAVKANKPACYQCWVFCPEGVIRRGIGCEVDLEYCKGCGICAEVCPAGAITMVAEHEDGK